MLKDLDEISQQRHDPPNGIPSSTLYADPAPPARSRGRPKKHINAQFLQQSLLHRSSRSIAANLGCSARTIRRRTLELHIAQPSPPVFLHQDHAPPIRNFHSRGPSSYARLSNFELDEIVASILVSFPSFGRRLVQGSLRTRGLHVQKHRITASIRRVTCRTRVFRRRVAERRVYRVAGPNSLWHHDGQHGAPPVPCMVFSYSPLKGLIRWKIIIHGFIDGYSRFVVGIRASNNNRADTVLDLFEECRCRTRATPHRCRGDCGMENVRVADRMADLRGVSSYIWGRSVLPPTPAASY